MSHSKVLFFLSGSIAGFKACQVISRLVQDGHEVQTIATPSALKFIGPATLEGLTGKPVLTDLWEPGRAMDHIDLTRWADMAVLCPASASSLARLATGLAEDLLGAMALAWPKSKPFHIFPAMNTAMYTNPITQEHLSRLAALGFTVAPTGSGNLACGETGEGRLLEPELILARLKGEAKGRVLITAGATREPIDGIRFLSNVSTGQTGATLADEFTRRGWQVTYLHGQGALQPTLDCQRDAFSSFADLDQRLRGHLDVHEYRAVIHCAAVSDYTIAEVQGTAPDRTQKLSSDQDLKLTLKPNFKILPRLKSYARAGGLKVIGFKLTLNASEEQILSAASKVWDDSVDAVVANDWSQVERDRLRHPGVWLTRGREPKPFRDLHELATLMEDFL